MDSISLQGYGHGGYGDVKKVFVASLGGWVARKTLRDYRFPEARMRFLREMELLQKLIHPNIIRVLKTAPYATPPYYLMEYMENGPLSRHLGKLDIEQKFRITLQITSALGYCHDQGVYHRDGKADNVLLDAKMNGKLADFGLGREEGLSLNLTRTPLGTRDHIAPEVLAGRKGDAASDIYSFGIVVYQIFTDGRWPRRDFRLSDSVGGLSSSFDRLISRMLSPDASLRPSAHECHNGIQKALMEYNRMLGLAGVPQINIEQDAKSELEVAAWTGGGAALGAIVGSLVDKNGAGTGAGIGAIAGLLVGLLK